MKKVVVGIDFGTSGIGYAYGFSDHVDRIILSNFHGQNEDSKVRSEIILDNDLEEIKAFGNECIGYSNTHKDKTSYEYFKNIKMNLYKKIYTIKSSNGKEADIQLIITKILKKISESALTQIQKSSDKTITKDNIRWVVTIPAIWEDKSKQIMINASIDAGLIKKNSDKSLFLALEPEVAGIYYYTISQTTPSFKSDHINRGEPYIICDIGAGTVDICTHRKIINNNQVSELIEEYPPIGGDFGGNKINEEFIRRLIVGLFGEEKVKKLQVNSLDEDWIKFERSIEEKKRACYDNEPCNLTLDCDVFDDELIGKSLDEYIAEYDKKNLKYKYKIQKVRKWKIEFSSQIFLDIAKEYAQKIFEKLEEIYNSVHTGYILLTGAGSKNGLISNYIYELAIRKNIKFEFTNPPQPDISIIKGAVIFGFQNNIIRKRKAKYTLGIKMSEFWEDKYEGKGIKTYLEIDGKYHCSNLFSKFITINQYIEFNEVIKHNYDALGPNPEIIFYKTNKKDCTYIDEKDEKGKLILEELGRVNFNIGEDFDVNNRGVTIEMRMGGTYIDCCATLIKNGKQLNIIQSFN